MQYWLSVGDGKSYGPYDVSQLQQLASEGRLNAQSQLCPVGGSSWVQASTVVSISGAAFPPVSPVGVAPSSPWTPVSLTGPILTTLCCCLIGGIVSLVYASNANSKGAAGDTVGAQRDAATSKTWMKVSIAIGAVFGFIYFIGMIVSQSR